MGSLRDSIINVVTLHFAMVLLTDGFIESVQQQFFLWRDTFYYDLPLNLLMHIENILKEVDESVDMKDYYLLAIYFEKYKYARETLKKEIFKRKNLNVFSLNYVKNNFAKSLVDYKCKLLLENKVTYDIFKDEQDLSNVVLSFACEMENNGDYLLASYIYVHWGKPLKALTIINGQLRKEIEKVQNTECSFNFNEYVDLGRNVSFNLRTKENNYTPNPSYDTIDIENKKKEIRLEIKFFYLLIKCYDAILQERNRNYEQVIRIFEEVGVIQNQKICATETLESRLLIEKLPDIILVILRSTLKSYKLCVKSSLTQDAYYFQFILQNSLDNISSLSLPYHISKELNSYIGMIEKILK